MKRTTTLALALLVALGMMAPALAANPAAPTGDPEADGWTFEGNSLEEGVYVRGVLNASYDIYTATFEVDDPEVFDISDHEIDEDSFYYNYYAGVPSSNLWDPSEDARDWEVGDTVVAVGGKPTDITAEDAGWEAFTGNEPNEVPADNRRQAKFGTEDATWETSTVAPDKGDGSGSTSDGGNATFLVRTTGSPNLTGAEDEPIGAKHAGEIMGLQQTNHISVSLVGPDVARLIWTWDDDQGIYDSWQILLNMDLIDRDLQDEGSEPFDPEDEPEGYKLTGEGDPIVTTVQSGGNGFTDGLVEAAAAEPADPADPEVRGDCMRGGWEGFGFDNQGRCIQFVNTGKDSR